MQLGKVLRCWMKANHVSIRALAKEIDLDHTVLFKICQGREGSARSFAKIIIWLMEPGR